VTIKRQDLEGSRQPGMVVTVVTVTITITVIFQYDFSVATLATHPQQESHV
jgi:hypothetical protein